MAGLRGVGLDLEPIPCGDPDDQWVQEREQWHSGTNFFAFAPGKVIGYARNEHTLAQLDRRGFAVLPAADVIAGRDDPDAHAPLRGHHRRLGAGPRRRRLPLHDAAGRAGAVANHIVSWSAF